MHVSLAHLFDPSKWSCRKSIKQHLHYADSGVTDPVHRVFRTFNTLCMLSQPSQPQPKGFVGLCCIQSACGFVGLNSGPPQPKGFGEPIPLEEKVLWGSP